MTYYLHKVFFLLYKFNFLWRQSLTRTRIRIDPHWFGSMDPDPDPDPNGNQYGSTTILFPVIHS